MNEYCRGLIDMMGGAGVLKAMIGAKNFVYDNKNTWIQFAFDLCKKANICKVEYDQDNDLVNLVFYKYNRRNFDCTEVERLDGLYVEDVKKSFTGFTGLDLNL